MKHKLNSSVERHMLANQKVWGSILGQGVINFLLFLYEFTRVFTQKLQSKTGVANTRCTREMELTESRV